MISPLRKKRFFGELTIYDLSQKTGIDPARISLMERGYKIPREDEKVKISTALNCEITEIFPGGNGGPGNG
jgi:transcriptional regulator with XRE-family HTH domain